MNVHRVQTEEDIFKKNYLKNLVNAWNTRSQEAQGKGPSLWLLPRPALRTDRWPEAHCTPRPSGASFPFAWLSSGDGRIPSKQSSSLLFELPAHNWTCPQQQCTEAEIFPMHFSQANAVARNPKCGCDYQPKGNNTLCSVVHFWQRYIPVSLKIPNSTKGPHINPACRLDPGQTCHITRRNRCKGSLHINPSFTLRALTIRSMAKDWA